jgi:DNA-binding CsgD family transcriptional regulator
MQGSHASMLDLPRGGRHPRCLVSVAAYALGVLDDRRRRIDLLGTLRREVGFDAYAFLLTDPETAVGSSPLADVPAPLLEALPRLIRAKYLTAANRWTALEPGQVALLSAADDGDPLRTLLDEHGVADVASLVFRDRFGCWGFLDLWRADGVFTAAEARRLAAIALPVTAALREAQAASFVARPSPASRPGPVVLLLSPELDVIGQTPQTHEYLRTLVPPERGRAPVPASAYNVAAQLLAAESGVDDNPASARVHLYAGLWLTLRAARIGADIAVTIEESTPVERLDLFSRASALSARESELLTHLLSGADTREVAGRMFLSEHTVQDHLKSVFAKTQTRNRRSLLARALGT